VSRIVAIVNPQSEAGKTAKAWPDILARLEARIGPLESRLTQARGHATALAREALAQGADWLICVGGDGTLNEVINGMFENDQPLNPEAQLSLIMRGTGGDFRKSLGLENTLEAYLEALATAPVRQIDLGKVTLKNEATQEFSRYFVNLGSFGMGGDVVHRIENTPWLKQMGGTPGFMLASLQSLSQFKPQRVRLQIDETLDWQIKILQVAVANGTTHGGGMRVAPLAELNDGWFDLVILTGIGPFEAALTFPRVYQGTHLSAPAVRHLRCRQLVAEALGKEPVWIEIDGETPGKLPAHFELLPGLLRLKG